MRDRGVNESVESAGIGRSGRISQSQNCANMGRMLDSRQILTLEGGLLAKPLNLRISYPSRCVIEIGLAEDA